MIDPFLRLSEALTGEAPLDRQLAGEYLQRVRATPEGAHVGRLLAEFAAIEEGGDTDAAMGGRIMGDTDLRKLVKVIILLWYFGEVAARPGDVPAVDGHPEHYFRGRFWSIVSAHVPGLSGGYFGHWSYPPDN